MATTIYTLELENGKYYVGKSSISKQRILKHFQDEGSEWTKLYKPKKVLVQVMGDSFDEEKHTLIAMEKYGIDNVRGGSYCKVKLSQYDKDKALQTIRSISDKCYKCGNEGHFAKDCFVNNCVDATEIFNYPNNEKKECDVCYGRGISYWSDGVYGTCMYCSCISCEKQFNKCKCRTCDKCNVNIMDDEEHKCYKCDKCNEHIMDDEEHKCYKCDKCNEYYDVKCYSCSPPPWRVPLSVKN